MAQWTPYSASAAVEGFDGEEHDADTLRSAWQYLIDTGTCWRLQGWYGRTANTLIASGECRPAPPLPNGRVKDALYARLPKRATDAIVRAHGSLDDMR